MKDHSIYHIRIHRENELFNYSEALTQEILKYIPASIISNDKRQGIYLATSNAGNSESVLFWKNVLEKTPAFANPANFYLTLSNAPAALIARILNIKGPVYTLVGREDAWNFCLQLASVALHEKEVELAWMVRFEVEQEFILVDIVIVTSEDEATIINC